MIVSIRIVEADQRHKRGTIHLTRNRQHSTQVHPPHAVEVMVKTEQPKPD